ncbi:MAG: hypothetical protein Tsb0021_00440 [Chlamydiales bacterium]
MKYLICLFLIILIYFVYSLNPFIYSVSNYNEASNKIIKNSIKEVKNKYPVAVTGIGGGIDHRLKKINIIDVMFRIYRKLNEDEAREIILDVLDIFLNKANNEQDLIPFLTPYPFTYEGFNITLFIMNESGKDNVFYPDLGFVTFYSKGKIEYGSYLPTNPIKQTDQRFETLEEAREKVKRAKES